MAIKADENNALLPYGLRVAFKLSDEIFGKGIIYGCVNNGAAIIGRGYAVKYDEISIDYHEYPMITAFECQLTIINQED
jgi:hypothetical protein